MNKDTRKQCIKCGMVANVDPALHAERYGHVPVIRENGKEFEFSFQAFRFVPRRKAA